MVDGQVYGLIKRGLLMTKKEKAVFCVLFWVNLLCLIGVSVALGYVIIADRSYFADVLIAFVLLFLLGLLVLLLLIRERRLQKLIKKGSADAVRKQANVYLFDSGLRGRTYCFEFKINGKTVRWKTYRVGRGLKDGEKVTIAYSEAINDAFLLKD